MATELAEKDEVRVEWQDGNKKQKLCSQERTVYLVVVESHQHVLEHIHTVLRKEKILNEEWSMLHFDAHPDLACPHASIPAKACFLPYEPFPSNMPATATICDNNNNNNNPQQQQQTEKNLYEMLDSTATGIAEWILPLVLAADLRTVHWIKPKWSAMEKGPPSQLPLGVHDLKVGAAVPLADCPHSLESFLELPNSAIVKVDWPHPYYLEDDCTVHFCEGLKETFHFAQPFRLHISELAHDESEFITGTSPLTNSAVLSTRWALDICLDYFACHNPFLTELEAHDPVYTEALLDAVFRSRFYSQSIMQTSSTIAEADREQLGTLERYKHDLHKFWRFILDLLQQSIQERNTSIAPQKDSLMAYYSDSTIALACTQSLVESFQKSQCSSDGMAPVDLIAMTEQILPNLMMPHQRRSEHDKHSIRPALTQVQQAIEGQSNSTGTTNPPFIITIARSALDGFTPSHVVDELQNDVIQFLHTIYCRCPRFAGDLFRVDKQQNPTVGTWGQCRLQIVFDYGIDEGSVFS
jgi:UPF0489 domain